MKPSEFWDCDYGEEQTTVRGFGIKLPSGFVAKFADKESRDKTLDAVCAEIFKRKPLMDALEQLATQTVEPRSAKVAADVLAKVKEGRNA